MSGHTDEERIDAIAREITNEIRCEERARERIAEAPLEGDVYLLKILLDVIDNQNAALKEQHPMVDSRAELVKALEECRKRLQMDLEEIQHLRGWLSEAELAERADQDELADQMDKLAIFAADEALVLATLTARKVG